MNQVFFLTKSEDENKLHVYRNNLCYIILKPDVFIRKLYQEILYYLEKTGYKIIDYRIFRLNHEIYTLMYEHEFTWELDDWQFNKDLFNFGPVCAVVLWYESGINDYQAQEMLSKNKGSAVPDYLQVNTLRHQFSSTSRNFNLIHIPVNFKSAIKELKQVFNLNNLEKQIDQYLKKKIVTAPEMIHSQLDKHGYYQSDCLKGEILLCFLKKRLFKELKIDDMLDSHIDHTINTLQQIKNFKKRKKKWQTAANRENDLIAIEMEKDNVEKPTLQFLTKLNTQYSLYALNFFFHILDKYRIYYSDLEQYCILSTFLYPTKSVSNEKGSNVD